MKNKYKITISLISCMAFATVLVFMASLTTPKSLRQKIVLFTIRDCIWYGYDDDRAFDKSVGEKSTIVLPLSLTTFTPTLKFGLQELNNSSGKCNLFYNPKGYEEKTWILTFKSNDLETLVEGNLTLWSDKTISRKRNMIKVAKKTESVKCYYYPPSEMIE